MSQETLVAVHEIHRATKPGQPGDKEKGIAAKPPEIQIIKPGTRFAPKDDKERKQLLDGKAARKLTAEEKGGKAAAATVDDDTPKAVKDMTGPELDAYVAEKGYDIEGYTDLKKVGERRAAVIAHEEGGDLV